MGITKVDFKTKPGELRWVFLQPGGIDASLAKDGSKMIKQACLVVKTDSAEYKTMKDELDKLWETFKAENNIKQKEYKSNGIKLLKDKETGELNGEASFVFKTNALFTRADGTAVDTRVPIFNSKGLEITSEFADKRIGNGSHGIIHGTAALYEFAKTYGITLYLKGIQLGKLEEYSSSFNVDDISALYPDAFGESFEV